METKEIDCSQVSCRKTSFLGDCSLFIKSKEMGKKMRGLEVLATTKKGGPKVYLHNKRETEACGYDWDMFLEPWSHLMHCISRGCPKVKRKERLK